MKSTWQFVIWFIQLQGTLVYLLLAAGWLWAGVMRRRECQRQQVLRQATARDAGDGTSLANEPEHWPQVSVVMPVKGCRAHSLSNWKSHLAVQYRGPMEFIFVVESEQDAAWGVLKELTNSSHMPGRDVRVLVAGLSQTCSQKIHNLCAGASSCSPRCRYILFLDDDVELHPDSVGELVSVLERDHTLFMATGYPFDVPPIGSGLPTYCALVYHMPLLIGLSAVQRSTFVWGGCAMLRAEQLRHDRYNILQAWQEGGYSDDLILAAKCSEHALVVAVPSSAIFPQWLDARMTWHQYFNYLHRQLYVLDTYATDHNRMVNHSMMALHSWASWATVMPTLLGVWLLLHGLGCGAWHMLVAGAAQSGSCMGLSAVLTNWGKPALLLLASAILAHAGLYYMTAEVLRLFSLLSPKRPRLWPRQYNWLKVWTALQLESLVLPAVMAYVWFVPSVEWGGVRYYKQHGKVARIER